MLKTNKKIKKIGLSTVSSVKTYHYLLNKKNKFFYNLVKTKKVKSPFWWTTINHIAKTATLIRYDLNLENYNKLLYLKKKKKLKKNILKRYKLKPQIWVKKIYLKMPKSIAKPHYLPKKNMRFIGPRTQRHWWLRPILVNDYNSFMRKRKPIVIYKYKKFDFWTPRGSHSTRKFLYIAKKLFKLYYNLWQNYKFKKILKNAKQTRKTNKLNFIFQKLESQLYFVLMRMGFCSAKKKAHYIIKSGMIYVNNKQIRLPTYQLKPNDFIKIVTEKKRVTIDTLAKFERLSKWSFIKRNKHYKHLHVNYERLCGIFLEYPKFNILRKNYGKSNTRLHDLFNYVISQARNIK